ncbi:thiol-disulfide isomerase/thioredoxin [Sphingomonas sp. F9_3S_D5_B_2]
MPSTPIRLTTVIAAAAALLGCGKAEQAKPTKNKDATEGQAGLAKGVDRSHKGTAAPDVQFVNGDGEETSIAEVGGGKPLLVNLWATWCAPCVKELPTLDKLAQTSKGVQVAAISQDFGPHASVEAFLTSRKITNLAAFQDSKMALSGALNAQILPTSILFDAKGQEVWRYVGDLDWTSPEAAKLLSEAGS